MTLGLVLAAALGQLDAGPATNLLSGLTAKAEKVANVERMTDGKAPDPGDSWQTILTSVIEKDGSVTWDFGSSREFEGVWIQADNNDVYVLQTSEDGEHFFNAWESSTVDNAGMQARVSTTARGRGRYLKLSAKGGDGMFSVGEIAVFSSGPQAKVYAPSFTRNPAAPTPQPFDGNWVVIALVLMGLTALVKRMRQPERAPATAAAAAAPEPKPEQKEEPPPAKP